MRDSLRILMYFLSNAMAPIRIAIYSEGFQYVSHGMHWFPMEFTLYLRDPHKDSNAFPTQFNAPPQDFNMFPKDSNILPKESNGSPTDFSIRISMYFLRTSMDPLRISIYFLRHPVGP